MMNGEADKAVDDKGSFAPTVILDNFNLPAVFCRSKFNVFNRSYCIKVNTNNVSKTAIDGNIKAFLAA